MRAAPRPNLVPPEDDRTRCPQCSSLQSFKTHTIVRDGQRQKRINCRICRWEHVWTDTRGGLA